MNAVPGAHLIGSVPLLDTEAARVLALLAAHRNAMADATGR